jgi:hypothetical protein
MTLDRSCEAAFTDSIADNFDSGFPIANFVRIVEQLPESGSAELKAFFMDLEGWRRRLLVAILLYCNDQVNFALTRQIHGHLTISLPTNLGGETSVSQGKQESFSLSRTVRSPKNMPLRPPSLDDEALKLLTTPDRKWN